MNNLLNYLKENISNMKSVPEIVEIFEKMCNMNISDELEILFETGTFSFTGEPLFYFSLVRQFQIIYEDEYYQIHVDVLFIPSAENALFSDTVWNFDTKEDIFSIIKNSQAYKYAKIILFLVSKFILMQLNI